MITANNKLANSTFMSSSLFLLLSRRGPLAATLISESLEAELNATLGASAVCPDGGMNDEAFLWRFMLAGVLFLLLALSSEILKRLAP